jgi:hypothetical protein
MFVGFPRSGHSLVGALLDAHPNIVIAHELHVVKRVCEGLTEREIYLQLLENSMNRAKEGRGTKRYSYEVADQWQGKFQFLRVIGDKQGGGSTRFLGKRPAALERLRSTITLKIKFFFALRNPFDNISTISLRNELTLDQSIDRYFSLCAMVDEIRKQIPADDLFELRHEALIDDPASLLTDLCQFLGEEATSGYLAACGRIVYKSPHKSRHKIAWSQNLISETNRRIAAYSFLNGYSFEN